MAAIVQFPKWRVDLEVLDFDDLKARMKDQTYEQCPECRTYLIRKKLPDADIPAGREHKPGTFQGVAAIAGNHGGNPGRNGKKRIPIQMRCIRL